MGYSFITFPPFYHVAYTTVASNQFRHLTILKSALIYPTYKRHGCPSELDPKQVQVKVRNSFFRLSQSSKLSVHLCWDVCFHCIKCNLLSLSFSLYDNVRSPTDITPFLIMWGTLSGDEPRTCSQDGLRTRKDVAQPC